MSKEKCCKINPKMKLSKEELGFQDDRIPDYYIGTRYKIEARKVIEDFELSYNMGVAVSYLLRAERKHDTPVDCITKAIAHLEFELDKIKR